MTSTRRPMHWARWGDPAEAAPLSESTRGLVELAFGSADPDLAGELSDVRLPEVALDATLLSELRDLVGPDHVDTSHEARVRHTRGRSTPDLLRLRHGDGADAPDAVVRPAGHDEVQALVSWCSDRRVALVPFGGGTSVVGGLVAGREGFAGVLALDLGRLDGLLSVDAESQTAELEAGMLGPEAEAALGEHGFVLGHYPQSFEYASVGGFAATRSTGQASAGYGRFDAMVTGLTLATPRGTWTLGKGPASAAGPDLRQLVLGSEGAFGVITSVVVRVRPVPEATAYDGWRFDSFADGVAALRSLVQAGESPTVLRLSDENETAVNLADPDSVGGASAGGVLVVTGHEGTTDAVTSGRALVAARLSALGGTALGEEPGQAWLRGRFHGPYLRDSLLDAGVLVETLETATSWSRMLDVHAAVSTALQQALDGASPLVLCHVSHVYPTGASLYFTVAARQGEDPLARWAAAKRAATDALVATGATITHHHAVGRDHQPWLADEIGDLGVDVLRAVKQRLDPHGVCNPGVLIPSAAP